MTTISIASTAAVFRLALAGACGIAMTSAASARAEPASTYRSTVEQSCDREICLPAMMNGRHGIATLAVTVRPDGTVRSVDIVRSSGVGAFDRAAVRTAQRVTYPAAPESRTLAMVLGFNQQVLPAQQSEGRALVAAYLTNRESRLAAGTAAQQPDS